MSLNLEALLSALFPLVCSGIFLLPAAILLYFFFRVRMKSNASMKWPYTSGRIISSEVRTNTEHPDDDNPRRVRYTYSPVVKYEYFINGQAYTASRIHYGVTPMLERAKAEQLAQHYVSGMPLKVYYNPANPNEAVLEQKSVSSYAGLVFGLIFVVLSACSCLMSAVGLIRMFR